MICPLCKNPDTIKLFTKDAVVFLRCLKCDFKFAETSGNANLQNAFENYDDAYVKYLENNITDVKNFESALAWIGQNIDISKSQVLDVGCGSGKFVRYLLGKSVDACGIEPSKTLFERYLSREEYFQNQTIESISEKMMQSWSVITVLDVLEHVEHPGSFMAALRKVLADDGCIFITTPDVGSVSARLLGRHWYFYHRYHLSLFSKSTFVKFCEKNGFNVEFRGRTNVYFSVGYIMRYVARLITCRSVESMAKKFDHICVPLQPYDRFGACLRKKTC